MKKTFSRVDKTLLFVTIFLSAFGLLMIFSASNIAAVLRYQVSSQYFFMKQLLFTSFGFIISLIIFKFPIKNYKKFIPPMVIGIMSALFLLFSYGSIVNSAQSWFRFGRISIQPTEFAKTVVIMYFAFYFSSKKDDKSFFYYIKPLIIAAVIIVLIGLQPDLGGAIIVAGIVFFIFLSIPSPKNDKLKLVKTIGIGIAIFAGVFMFFGKNLLNETQAKRFIYQNPCSRYIDDTGYQVCNSLIAFSNGGIFGKGLGNSSQKYLYLPEAHTDFIFPIIAEELGAVGATGVILLYIILLWRLLVIAKRSETLRGSIIAYGTFLMLLLHILINLLGVLAIMPLTGVPLPLLSSGGSYQLNVLILLALCQRVSIESKIIKAQRDIKNL